jgi:hypothetical protein
VISLAVAAAGWVLLVTRRLRRYPISTTFETPPKYATSNKSYFLIPPWSISNFLRSCPLGWQLMRFQKLGHGQRAKFGV